MGAMNAEIPEKTSAHEKEAELAPSPGQRARTTRKTLIATSGAKTRKNCTRKISLQNKGKWKKDNRGDVEQGRGGRNPRRRRFNQERGTAGGGKGPQNRAQRADESKRGRVREGWAARGAVPEEECGLGVVAEYQGGNTEIGPIGKLKKGRN